ncbi:MAG: hypothetical protein JO352_13155 [Chloroflexi bacterium]|nr:hypothetical protein [Chloroflexota bacterium]
MPRSRSWIPRPLRPARSPNSSWLSPAAPDGHAAHLQYQPAPFRQPGGDDERYPWFRRSGRHADAEHRAADGAPHHSDDAHHAGDQHSDTPGALKAPDPAARDCRVGPAF